MSHPHRTPTYAEPTMRETLEQSGWKPRDGGYRAPDGYGLLATFTTRTAFEIESESGEYRRRFPYRPSLWRRIRFWYFGWELRRAIDRERRLAKRAARKEEARLSTGERRFVIVFAATSTLILLSVGFLLVRLVASSK